MQIKSRGIRLDLRTLIHGYMSPFQIRTVMETAQKLRIMFFQSHVCFIYINAYISIRTILLNVCLRELETERNRKNIDLKQKSTFRQCSSNFTAGQKI